MQHPDQLASPLPAMTPALEQAGRLLVAETVEREPYAVFTNPYERMDYMHLTDDLIVKLDGTASPEKPPYDAVVYLDSSARPISWMVNGLWDFAARKDEQGAPVAKPQTLFANIDARRTSKRITAEDTVSLHDTYPGLAAWSEQADEAPRRVLIVDEIAVSGDTLDIARRRFDAAFPGVQFDEYAWKDERNVPEFNRDNVRWYERHNDRYRTVLDVKELSSEQREELAERGITVSDRWLSVINPDQEGAKQLRREVERLVQDVTTGEMPYWPSAQRPDEQLEALVSAHDDGLTLRQFRVFREWFKRYYAPSPLANLITTDANGPLTEKEARKYMDERQRRQKPPQLDAQTAAFAKKFGY